MLDRETRRCTCADEQRPPPGSGIALGSLFGLGCIALAVLVWILSGAWVWTLLTWLFAGPAFLLGLLIWEAGAAAEQPLGCNDRRCSFRLWPSSYNGAVNV